MYLSTLITVSVNLKKVLKKKKNALYLVCIKQPNYHMSSALLKTVLNEFEIFFASNSIQKNPQYIFFDTYWFLSVKNKTNKN